MPQGRRKTPYSGKAKKEQLKSKKQNKQFQNKSNFLLKQNDEEESCSGLQKLNYQPSKDGHSHSNRYALQFFKESNQEIANRKEQARHSLEPINIKNLEIDGDNFFLKELDFPKRPPWSFNLSKQELDSKENRYFTEYINNIEKQFDWKELSFFELNLETWRQLWRVLEMSDIILLIVDIRFPALMFPPSLYNYVTRELNKDFILVLNKIDLVPASVVVAWKHYFQTRYPDLHIVMFTTLPGYNLLGKQSDKGGLLVRRRKGRVRMAAEGTQQLFEVCKQLVGENVDLTSWQTKIKEETTLEFDENEKVTIEEKIDLKQIDTDYYEHEKYKNGILSIGCLGQPNVGKSSLMNAIMGKKVVSVSKTPGHTKHFQTIFLTQNVRLCDCPGLVFPSKIPKPLQVLMGSYPIAQLREPFTAVKYIAERLDLPKLLRMDHPENDDQWSAMDVCDGWAKKRGYVTAKAARLDSYRAANSLLRMALDGKICLCLKPPEYYAKQAFWASHPDIEKVKWIQARTEEFEEETVEELSFSEESDNEENVKTGIDDADEKESQNATDSEESSEDEAPVQYQNKFAALGDE